MKLYKTLIISILLVGCSAYSQVNLITPSNNNLSVWILAQNNVSGIQFKTNHKNDNRYSSISFREIIQNFDCHSFSCASKKKDVQEISLEKFNNEYRAKTITFTDIKSRLDNCKKISDYLNERARKVTYFIVENNKVKIYNKAYCSVAIEGEGIDYEEVD